MTARLRPLPLVWLTTVWVLLWGEVSWANVLGGLALAALVLVLFPLPRLSAGVMVHPWAALVLAARFAVDLVVASVRVAALVLRPGPMPEGLVLDVPLRSRDELLLTITAELVGLVPGTVVIDLDAPAGILTVHSLQVRDADDVRAEQRSLRDQEARVLAAFARTVPQGVDR